MRMRKCIRIGDNWLVSNLAAVYHSCVHLFLMFFLDSLYFLFCVLLCSIQIAKMSRFQEWLEQLESISPDCSLVLSSFPLKVRCHTGKLLSCRHGAATSPSCDKYCSLLPSEARHCQDIALLLAPEGLPLPGSLNQYKRQECNF